MCYFELNCMLLDIPQFSIYSCVVMCYLAAAEQTKMVMPASVDQCSNAVSDVFILYYTKPKPHGFYSTMLSAVLAIVNLSV